MGPQEHKVERRLAAIFAADMAGYSRLMTQARVPQRFNGSGS
jgi:adenylate cyclase